MTDLRFYDPDADESGAAEDLAAAQPESQEREFVDSEAEVGVEAGLPGDQTRGNQTPGDRGESVDVPVAGPDLEALDAEDDELDGDDDSTPGGLLAELERRQDEVLLELDRLNDQVEDVLRSLGVRLDGDPEDAVAEALEADDSHAA